MTVAEFDQIVALCARSTFLVFTFSCHGPDCTVREFTATVEDLDETLLADLASRPPRCPLCRGTNVTLEAAQTGAEHEAEADQDARWRVNVQMWQRDHPTGDDLTPIGVILDTRLPPTPPGWWPGLDEYIAGIQIREADEGDAFWEEDTVQCPTCGGHYSHIAQVYTRLGGDEGRVFRGTQPNGTTSWRRSALVVEFDGECGHRFEWVIQQHKGQNYVYQLRRGESVVNMNALRRRWPRSRAPRASPP